MKCYDVLIVEDDIDLCEALCDTLAVHGYQVIAANNGVDALDKLELYSVKLVISDVQMPVMDGIQLLQTIQKRYAYLPVLLMTAYGTIPKAVTAMQAGALDYLIKPFEAALLVNKVSAFMNTNIVTENAGSVAVLNGSMQKLYELIAKVAKTDVAVLLQGESGTGKEVVAQYIHRHSKQQSGPYVAVNCAAIPENMLEAMLFGYEKGAFTGAVQAMPGKFEQAQGGTLLLDEIAEMDLNLQAKLLRVLQEKELERLGSRKKISLDVRILAATNQKLKQHMQRGLFREDLYYRLNVFPITIPPLRHRVDDILPLAKELLLRHCPAGKKLPHIDSLAADKLLNYSWPGNVRELDNVLQRALILCASDRITAADLVFEESALMAAENGFNRSPCPETGIADSEPPLTALEDGVRSAEETIILQTLQLANGSRKTAAEKLGISARTLRYKMARMKDAGVNIPC